jgi:hypothetical protein
VCGCAVVCLGGYIISSVPPSGCRAMPTIPREMRPPQHLDVSTLSSPCLTPALLRVPVPPPPARPRQTAQIGTVLRRSRCTIQSMPHQVTRCTVHCMPRQVFPCATSQPLPPCRPCPSTWRALSRTPRARDAPASTKVRTLEFLSHDVDQRPHKGSCTTSDVTKTPYRSGRNFS